MKWMGEKARKEGRTWQVKGGVLGMRRPTYQLKESCMLEERCFHLYMSFIHFLINESMS
jgi:hypothetical protein